MFSQIRAAVPALAPDRPAWYRGPDMEQAPDIQILHQLRHDFPGHLFGFDDSGPFLTVDGLELFLSLTAGELRRIDLFTPTGRNYYQAVVNHIYRSFDIAPGEGSLASTMIVSKEEAFDYRVRTLAQRMGIGFLEGDEEAGAAFAVEIDDGREAAPPELEYEEPEEDLEELEGAD